MDITGPIRFVTGHIDIPEEVQAYMITPTPQYDFSFLDPTDVLVRLLLYSPLAKDPDNLKFFPTNGPSYNDFCDGSRLRRVTNSLPKGTAALTCVLFFDEINKDEKGLSTADGGVIVGGFFKKALRESTYAKAHFATFHKPEIQKVRTRARAVVVRMAPVAGASYWSQPQVQLLDKFNHLCIFPPQKAK